MTDNMKEFFDRKIILDAEKKELKLLKKACHDCAVTSGFYSCYSEELKLQSDDVREKVSKKWLCHNNVDRACKGNADFQELSW